MGEHAVDLEAWEEYDANRGSFVHHMIAGSIAGVAEHVAMFPVDTYKVSATRCALRRSCVCDPTHPTPPHPAHPPTRNRRPACNSCAAPLAAS